MIQGLGDMGLSLALSAIGSGLGAGVAGEATIGAWKKMFMRNKAAAMIMMSFVGAPLSQTIYGMILRNAIKNANLPPETTTYQMILGGVAGFAIGLSAYFQGRAGACAADAYGETGKGFANYIMVLGITETVALFVLAFSLTALPKLAG